MQKDQRTTLEKLIEQTKQLATQEPEKWLSYLQTLLEFREIVNAKDSDVEEVIRQIAKINQGPTISEALRAFLYRLKFESKASDQAKPLIAATWIAQASRGLCSPDKAFCIVEPYLRA